MNVVLALIQVFSWICILSGDIGIGIILFLISGTLIATNK